MEYIIEITYLIATALFILSLKWLSSPTTARRGVFAGELGMLLAIVGLCCTTASWNTNDFHRARARDDHRRAARQSGHDCGAAATALSHAFGALCVTLVGTAEFYLRTPNVPRFMMGVLSMEVILGSLTFTGSLMAAGKLQEILPQRPITYKGQNFVNLGLLAVAIIVAGMLVAHPEKTQLFPLIVGIPSCSA